MSRPHPKYRRVSATPEETADYLRKHPGQRSPSVYRVQCRDCGQRLWGSGLGIGSHNSACPGCQHLHADATMDRGLLMCRRCGQKFEPRNDKERAQRDAVSSALAPSDMPPSWLPKVTS